MIVEFNVTAFRNRHPFFTEDKISDEALEYQFDVACAIIPNTEDSFVPYDPENGVMDRGIVLDALTCHLATMAIRDPNQSGPVASAGEGSVNVSYGMLNNLGGEWFNQTPCGSTFWQLMKLYRTWGGRMVSIPNYHPWG